MSSTVGTTGDTTTGHVTGHPIAGFPGRLHAVLDRLADVPAWSMTAAEQRDTVVELTRAVARVEELRLRVLAAGDRGDLAAGGCGDVDGCVAGAPDPDPRGRWRTAR